MAHRPHPAHPCVFTAREPRTGFCILNGYYKYLSFLPLCPKSLKYVLCGLWRRSLPRTVEHESKPLGCGFKVAKIQVKELTCMSLGQYPSLARTPSQGMCLQSGVWGGLLGWVPHFPHPLTGRQAPFSQGCLSHCVMGGKQAAPFPLVCFLVVLRSVSRL